MRTRLPLMVVLACVAVAAAVSATPRPRPSGPTAPDFGRQILPLLKRNCGSCHGAAKTSGLSVLSVEDLLRGGSKAGPAVLWGRSAQSPIILYLTGKRSPSMPLGGKAPAGLAALLGRWIDAHARTTSSSRSHTTALFPAGWPYNKPVRYAPPHIRNAVWARSPIDVFILAELDRRGMHPAPEASRRDLIRRATFDLWGMPPDPADVERFVHDPAPRAYEKLIDRLLASPHYGERWARHWLDLARYADTDGYEQDDARPNAWRYRDYVIRAFNEDKPYDRFVMEQLAGDELWPGDPDALIATGFLRNGPWDALASDHKARWNDFLTDITDTTGSVFLGLTMGCARCHDHKYDPIPQRDYYRLQAFFANIQRVEVPLPESQAAIARRFAACGPVPGGARPVAMAVEEPGAMAPAHYLLRRGDITMPGAEVTPGFPTALAHGAQPQIVPHLGGHSTGRRSALANWIASADNPQTARVLVNRVWQYHFGAGLVPTSSDFGRNGDPPSSAKLLDWLAATFESPAAPGGANLNRAQTGGLGWSMKRLTRLIMTSSTYRQSTGYDPVCARKDPYNRLLWRMNRQRLDGEELRDAILTVSGRLNPEMGGPGVYPDVEAGVLDTGSTHKWGSSPPEEQLRRTIYVFQRRSVVLPIVDAYDGADMSGACPRRAVTTIAPQALILLNSPFARSEAAHFAARVAVEAGPSVPAEVDRAFAIAFCRPPSAAERAVCLAFLARQAAERRPDERTAAATGRALSDLCSVLINSNEFVYLD